MPAKRNANSSSTSATVNVNVNVNVSKSGAIDVEAAQPVTKKAKPTPKSTAPEKKKENIPVSRSPAPTNFASKRPKQVARKSVPLRSAPKDAKASNGKLKLVGVVPNKKRANIMTATTVRAERRTAPANTSYNARSMVICDTTTQDFDPYHGEGDDAPPPYSAYDPALSPRGW
ncbi:hypothetical protein POX_a01148 [Penicillium oxalicum]|uniref:hypothetical protein n=1 Tax=Penicillium oxalicum TaxID=69781 RepID=UPI0020B805BC|nr:hypothetical protein POX_a01148 [Penicillium oxalicum]KAI2794549.1 hypothetical protein POX_a01148 [Penicillium oxalicum]